MKTIKKTKLNKKYKRETEKKQMIKCINVKEKEERNRKRENKNERKIEGKNENMKE